VTRHGRLALFAMGAAGLAALLVWNFQGLPAMGDASAYGDLLTYLSVAERRAQNAVSGMNFDIRATNTLFEELILVAATTGVTVLLRRLADEYEQPVETWESQWPAPPPVSEPVRAVALGVIGPIVVVGLALIAHGHLTPGGGVSGRRPHRRRRAARRLGRPDPPAPLGRLCASRGGG